MSLVRLRTFVEVYRLRSISGAARSLALTQSNVSQHIAGLEVAFGRTLFERRSRGVEPTMAADELAQDLGDLLDRAEEAMGKARARSSDLAGVIRIIGHADFIAEEIVQHLPSLIAAGMRVRLQPAHRDLVQQMLLEGHFDLGVSAYPIVDARLHSEIIRDEPVHAVAAPQVAARIKAASSLEAGLRGEVMVAYNLDRPLIDTWLRHQRLGHVDTSPGLTSPDLRVLRQMLQANVGWSVLPDYMCREYIAEGRLVKIAPTSTPLTNPYSLVWLPTALRNPRVAHARQTLLRGLRGG
ncbi:LysR family transcriptional regulator [Novosphingobium aerophilum]|uniref:LysR family transcriptional regulator n=1 Tax=Novosphingobium TaxID=165696 RepID=UPI00104621EA|nr:MULTISPECIES: LysR family transcriptional regulator [unclassified Novosphingobium]TCM38695.1 DNA-binding transcriptional LysR family regulator [Novosphingobium sp. ST904]WRT95875.1 LysR family transcriptional regulator [Novosphingobium sp. RL4]